MAENFGPGVLGGVVLVDPESGAPYRVLNASEDPALGSAMAAEISDPDSATSAALSSTYDTLASRERVGRGAPAIAGLRSDFSWFRRSRWGFMAHYVQGNATYPQTVRADGTRPATVAALADEFDVTRFVADMASWGVDYVIFTAWHHAFNLLYPSTVVGSVLPTHVSTRDVIQELSDGLHAHGIKLVLYFDPCALIYMTTADQNAIGFNDATGGYAAYKTFINSLVTEMGNRYGAGVDGYWMDQIRHANWKTKIDHPTFRTALLAGNQARIVMGNAIDDGYDLDAIQVTPSATGLPASVINFGTREYATFMGKPAAISDWIGGHDHTISICTDSDWWAIENSSATNQLAYPEADLYRFAVLQAGVNRRGGGMTYAAGPYAGLGLASIWEPGVEAGMDAIAARVVNAGESLRNVIPSRSFPTANTLKISGLPNGFVATTAADGLTEYLHVLTAPAGALTTPATMDGAELISGTNMATRRPVQIGRTNAGGYTITLDPADTWDALHTVLKLDKSPASPAPETMWLPATVWNATDVNPTITRRGSYTPVYQMPDAVSSTIVVGVTPPPHWQEYDVVLHWLVTAATTAGICYLTVGRKATPRGSILSTTGEVSVVHQIQTPGVADRIDQLRIFRGVPNEGFTYLRLNRWGTGGADTSTQTFGVVGVELRRTR